MIIKQTTTLIFEYPQDYLQEQEWCKTKEDRWIHKGTDTLGAVYENTISYSIGQPSNSEIPNNCEHITEDGVTCAKYPACDDCLDNPLNKLKGSERLVKGSEKPNSSTISKMEQVDKDINVRSKTEPQTMLNDGTLVINVEDATKVGRVLIGDDKNRGGLYYPDDEDEPQTCSVSGRPYSECADCEHFRCTADEPQTERSGVDDD